MRVESLGSKLRRRQLDQHFPSLCARRTAFPPYTEGYPVRSLPFPLAYLLSRKCVYSPSETQTHGACSRRPKESIS
jgi:hypothetical protein